MPWQNPAATINGLKGGRPPKYNKELVCELYAQGVSKGEIAERLGCSWRTVHRVVKNNRT